MFKFSKTSLERREGVDDKLIEISDLALQISPIDFGIPEFGGKRTSLEQRDLYNIGSSRCDGYAKRSKHQLGRALDFYAFVDGKVSWDINNLTMIANALFQAASYLGYGIQWGGLWKNFEDYGHIELI